jgi:hypothetical protein
VKNVSGASVRHGGCHAGAAATEVVEPRQGGFRGGVEAKLVWQVFELTQRLEELLGPVVFVARVPSMCRAQTRSSSGGR